ncbi:MAG: transglycosylase family protein [Dermatophilaceae bacterium]
MAIRATLRSSSPYAGRHRAARRPSRALLTAAGSAAAVGAILAPTAAHADTVWDAVADCESSGNWSINTGNGYYGGLQFSASTWTGFGGGKYAPYAHQASKGAQIYIAQAVLKVQGPGAWPVCGARAGLTVTNGLAVDPWTDTTGSGGSTGGSSSTKLVVDGVLGPKTYGAMEKWIGRPVDGSFTLSDRKALQAKLKVTADGVIGPITTKALQKVVAHTQDGIWDSSTTKALQTYLNKVL